MKIGFIGLGVMGLPMALNIVNKSGNEVWGYDVSEKQLDIFSLASGKKALSAEQLFENCDITFLSLPTNQLVCAYLDLGIKHANRGAIIVDLSSSYPAVIRERKSAAAAAGVGLVDCPVSGGEPAAKAGTLASMCGGTDEDIAVVRPYLEMFSSSVIHMGDIGCGYAAKLANNMIIGSEIAVIAEALNYVELAGLDKNRWFEAIRRGGAGSNVLEIKGPKMLSKDYSASSTLAVHLKDQRNAIRLAQETGAYMPFCTMATEMMAKLEEQGRSKEDVAVIAELFSAISNAE